jgi:hypothetical protein
VVARRGDTQAVTRRKHGDWFDGDRILLDAVPEEASLLFMQGDRSIVGCVCAVMLVSSCGEVPAPAAEQTSSPTTPPTPGFERLQPADVVRPPDFEGLGPPMKGVISPRSKAPGERDLTKATTR